MPAPTCSECARSLSVNEAYELNSKIYCATCVQAAAQRAKDAGQPVTVTRYIDKSVCPRCNTYIGEGGGVAAGPARLCLPCSELVQNWPYPQWLRLALAGLLLLLVFALAHGRKYFEAGKNLYRGEQLVEKGKYAEALPYLKNTLKIAPDSDKGALLTAKAALLSGDVYTAHLVLTGHEGGHFQNGDSPEFREVNALWQRATSALDEIDKAQKLEAEDGKEEEAAKMVHHAATVYPEMQYLNLLVNRFDAGVDFANKNYDGFLARAEKDWNALPAAATAAMLASALACKFAVTGDLAFRRRSEDMLAKAKELAKDDKQSLDNLAEFEPRIHYRLDSRRIITKSEYDKEFRSGKAAGK
ncbi:MAG TPA: hypothetical protein VMJ35_13305 [Dongiaceae bacterium]|nr:hypothetical protein [Dongiaceae bacterium]